MRYTNIEHFGAVHLQTIAPLDERIVRLAVSCSLPGYKEKYADTLLELYTRMAQTGTRRYSKEELQSYLQKNGIQLKITQKNGVVTFTLTVTSAKLPEALTLLDEIIFNPAAKESEFANIRSRMLEEIREAKDDAKAAAEMHFLNCLYPKHSRFRSDTLDQQKKIVSKSTVALVREISSSLLKGEWHLSAVLGEADAKHIAKLAKKLSKNAHAIEREAEGHTVLPHTEIYETIPGKTNVEIRIGNILPITLRDDDFVPFSFGLSVLGKVGGFSGRLMSTVREKEGLTYGIYAHAVHASDRDTGHWDIFTFFTARDLKRGIASTMRELSAIVHKGITPSELSVFKEIFRNQHLINHESNLKRLNLYHGAFIKGITESDIKLYLEQLEAQSTFTVGEALQKFIDPKRCIVTGAGPVTKDGKGII